MQVKKNKIGITVIILIAVAAAVGGLFVSQHMPAKTKAIARESFNGTLLDKPRAVNQFSLTGVDEKTFSNESLKGQWTMVFFGFTSCGYLCPTTMAELAKMYHALEEKGANPLPKVVMISVDPERDDLPKLKNYVQSFNANFYGARGEDADVAKMARELGIAYTKVAMPNAENLQHYDVEHSGAVMLFNPQGELIAFFTTPHNADKLAQDYLALIS